MEDVGFRVEDGGFRVDRRFQGVTVPGKRFLRVKG